MNKELISETRSMILAVTKYNFIFSIALIILGVVSYFQTSRVSVTALIPTFVGIAMLICALLSLVPGKLHKHAMHTITLLALLGSLGSANGVPAAYKLLVLGIEIDRPEAAIAKATMALLCFAYLVIPFKWFLNNRRKKTPQMIA